MRTTCGSPLVPVRMSCRSSSSRCTSFAGRRGAQAEQEARALRADHRPDHAASRGCCRDSSRTFASRPSLSMMSTHGLDHRAGHRAAAEGRAEVVDASGAAPRGRPSAGPRTGKPAPSALAVVIMSGVTPYRFAANGIPGAAHAALHFVEDQQRAGRRAARRAAPRGTARPGRSAPATPCTGSTITAAVSVPMTRASAARSPRGTNSTSNGACGKPYHFCAAPQVTAPAAAVRPWKLPSTATTLRRPVIAQGELQRVLVGLGAAVDEEDRVEAEAGEARQRAARRARAPRAARRCSGRSASAPAARAPPAAADAQ